VHREQIVKETENLKKHAESVLAHEAQLHWHVKQCLSEVSVSNCEPSMASKHVACQHSDFWENEDISTKAWSLFPLRVLFHL
jgi:hypothetical protein